MKALLILVALLVSNFAQADGWGMRSFNCDKGDDGIGGKYCHYEFSKCISNTCEEAVECIVKKVHQDREGKAVTVHIAKSQVTQTRNEDGEQRTAFPVQSHKNGCNGRQCLTPMIVYTGIRSQEVMYKPGQCEPTALKLIGNDNF